MLADGFVFVGGDMGDKGSSYRGGSPGRGGCFIFGRVKVETADEIMKGGAMVFDVSFCCTSL